MQRLWVFPQNGFIAAVHDTWTPVRLRVRGGAREREVLAEVIVDAEISMGRQPRGLRYPIGSYGHELSLPPGETREVTVWFPASSGSGSFTARARLRAGGETLAETAVPIEVTRAGWPPSPGRSRSPAVVSPCHRCPPGCAAAKR